MQIYSLSFTSHINCIVARCLINVVNLRHVCLSGHDDFAFLNYVTKDAESTYKVKNYVVIASLKSVAMGKLINRIPGLPLLISCLPGSTSKTYV